VALATLGIPPLLGSIGDGLPFLLPNRWFMAKRSVDQSDAASLAFQIMQANLAAEVHTLAYLFKHDQTRLKIFQDLKIQVIEMNKKIRLLLDQGKIENHPYKAFQAYTASLDIGEVRLVHIFGASRRAISQALGFLNPKGVSDIRIDEEIESIQNATAVDVDELAQNAIQTSVELQQIKVLLMSMSAKKAELAFNWMDPNGNPATSLGLNLIPQFRGIKSEQNELHYRSGQMIQQLTLTASAIGGMQNRAISSFKEMNETLELHQERLRGLESRLDDVLNDKDSSIKLELTVNEIIRAFKDIISLTIQIEDELERWNLAHVKRNRLLYRYTLNSSLP
jgi:hypothetical protein